MIELRLLPYLYSGGLLAAVAFAIYLIIKIEKVVKELQEQIEIFRDEMHNEYVKKVDFYSDISGWRGDLKMLMEKLDRLKEEFYYLKGRYDELKGGKDE